MNGFEGCVSVGLRDKDTNKLVAIYPECVSGQDTDIEDKVKFWYYQKSCGAEEMLRNCYVDVVSDEEMKSFGVK